MGLRVAIEQLVARRSISALAAGAESLSARYRRGERRGSRDWHAAYAAVRMPATYAAVCAVMGRLLESCPEAAPVSMLDLGTGPGTAVWCGAEVFGSLRSATGLDRDGEMLALARELALEGGLGCAVDWRHLDGSAADVLPVSDIVVGAYVLNEIPQASRERLVERAWGACTGWMVIVEPGTPDAFRELLRTRSQLIELGGRVAAPCPKGGRCPMAGGGSWCHFSQRLSRTRTHRLAKRGSLGFEDEKYCYLVVEKGVVEVARPARVVAHPRVGKGDARLDLCTGEGLIVRTVRKRDVRWREARKVDWGDVWVESEGDETGQLR